MIDLISAAMIAASGTGMIYMVAACAVRLWRLWRNRRTQMQCVIPPPRRIGKVFPDEGDIEIAVEIVNGKEPIL